MEQFLHLPGVATLNDSHPWICCKCNHGWYNAGQRPFFPQCDHNRYTNCRGARAYSSNTDRGHLDTATATQYKLTVTGCSNTTDFNLVGHAHKFAIKGTTIEVFEPSGLDDGSPWTCCRCWNEDISTRRSVFTLCDNNRCSDCRSGTAYSFNSEWMSQVTTNDVASLLKLAPAAVHLGFRWFCQNCPGLTHDCFSRRSVCDRDRYDRAMATDALAVQDRHTPGGPLFEASAHDIEFVQEHSLLPVPLGQACRCPGRGDLNPDNQPECERGYTKEPAIAFSDQLVVKEIHLHSARGFDDGDRVQEHPPFISFYGEDWQCCRCETYSVYGLTYCRCCGHFRCRWCEIESQGSDEAGAQEQVPMAIVIRDHDDHAPHHIEFHVGLLWPH